MYCMRGNCLERTLNSPALHHSCCRPGFSTEAPKPGINVLQQVVTNRGPNHVVDCFGRKTRQPGYAIVVTGPAIFRKVRVLNSPAEAALRAIVRP
jgi:hypothetical protein